MIKFIKRSLYRFVARPLASRVAVPIAENMLKKLGKSGTLDNPETRMGLHLRQELEELKRTIED